MSPVQLQKAVFLVDAAELEGLPRHLYDFEPDYYGPLDTRIYKDADELHEEGLLLRARSREGDWVETIITPLGWEKAEKLREELPTETRRRLDEIAQEVQSMTLQGLLRFIYEKYPKYRQDGIFQEAIP